MERLEVSRRIAAPPDAVWDVLTDWERQATWMIDARSVELLTPQRTGVGVALRCPTRILGITVEDRLRVTGWDPPHRLEVEHLGRIITGRAAFELEADAVDGEGAGTRLRWWEEVDPPLGALGRWATRRIVLPYTARLFARSLDRLAAIVERPAVT